MLLNSSISLYFLRACCLSMEERTSVCLTISEFSYFTQIPCSFRVWRSSERSYSTTVNNFDNLFRAVWRIAKCVSSPSLTLLVNAIFSRFPMFYRSSLSDNLFDNSTSLLSNTRISLVSSSIFRSLRVSYLLAPDLTP